MLRRNCQCVQACFIRIRDTSRKLFGKQLAYFDMAFLRRKHEWCIVVHITADLELFVTRFDEVFRYLDKVICSGQMETCVALVLKIGIAEELRVVARYSFDEQDIIEQYGPP